MIPTYFFALPILRHFPTCLFHGVFLFLAYSNTIGNEFFQRMLLLFTEQVIPPLISIIHFSNLQRSYPPTHYIRRVPQRIVHLFTGKFLFNHFNFIHFIRHRISAICSFVGNRPFPLANYSAYFPFGFNYFHSIKVQSITALKNFNFTFQIITFSFDF
jgi:hypothetical protein